MAGESQWWGESGVGGEGGESVMGSQWQREAMVGESQWCGKSEWRGELVVGGKSVSNLVFYAQSTSTVI